MNPNKITTLPLSQVTAFLAHVGARLGQFRDPPCSSYVIEGGWYRGELYDGLVITPTVPTAGATRIDAVVANPATGEIEVIAGTEDSGVPPTIDPASGVAPIASVHVAARDNSKVIIEKGDIHDRRSVLQAEPEGGFRLLAQVRVNVGRSMPTVNTLLASGKLKVTATKNWTKVNKPGGRPSGTQVAFIELKYMGSVSDFHVVPTPYNSIMSVVTAGQDNWSSGQGVTWVSVPSDDDGYPKFRVMMAMVNAHGDEGDQERITSYNATTGKYAASDLGQAQIQVWGTAA